MKQVIIIATIALSVSVTLASADTLGADREEAQEAHSTNKQRSRQPVYYTRPGYDFLAGMSRSNGPVINGSQSYSLPGYDYRALMSPSNGPVINGSKSYSRPGYDYQSQLSPSNLGWNW